MRILLNLNQSLDAIRANLFRAGVTIFIIALGITALVVVMTSIEGIKSGMSESFSALGTNTFRIRNRASQVNFGRRKGRVQRFPLITYRQATAFQERFSDRAIVSITGGGGGANQVKFQEKTSNPNISMTGTDQYYLQTSKLLLEEGRGISEDDVALGRNVVVIGADVKEVLFPFESPLGKVINVSGNILKVIGSLKKLGSSGMSGTDRTVLVPISTLRSIRPNMGSLTLNVFAEEATTMDALMSSAEGEFRLVRSLTVRETSNFSVSRSDAFVGQLLDQTRSFTLAAQIIAMITLLGATIALLNVMLVSVTERTNEIGLRKALGASKQNIRLQFLFEAIVICQLGGLLGILMGVLGGNLVSNLAFKGTFVVPWDWIFIGITACLIVGVISGYYPANKAARVDPIDALRYV